jgi:hypothetical protein
VASRGVVDGLDVVEDSKLGVAPAGRYAFVQAGVGLERAPERFHGGVVVAIAGAAHTAFDPGAGEGLEVVVIDVLVRLPRIDGHALGTKERPNDDKQEEGSGNAAPVR